MIERAEGCTVWDTDGNAYIDGVSSLWCNVHGHRHPRIDAAVREQLDRVAHTTMLGLTHPGAIELARAARRPRARRAQPRLLLRQRLDGDRDRAEDGLPVPPPARRVVAVGLRLPEEQLPRRHARARCRSAGSSCSTRSTGRCCSRPGRPSRATPPTSTRCSTEHGERIAAVIVEPLVQGAAGILVHPDGLPARGARAVRPRTASS